MYAKENRGTLFQAEKAVITRRRREIRGSLHATRVKRIFFDVSVEVREFRT